MNNIANAFKHGKAFIAFLTAGDPTIEKTEEFILEAVRGGADLIEIGIPFSDPIAEGIVIQEADIRALRSGTTPDKIFAMVARLRKKTDVPLVFMSYVNPLFHYGFDAFFAKCAEVGIDGVILPDVPYEEKEEIRETAEKHGVAVISMIAPTSEQRIAEIAKNASGFMYVVSSLGVTGVRSEIQTDLPAILDVVRRSSDIPAAVGFGISTPEQARKISQCCDGVIVGSAIVRIIAQYGEAAGPKVYEYVKSMVNAING